MSVRTFLHHHDVTQDLKNICFCVAVFFFLKIQTNNNTLNKREYLVIIREDFS